VAILCFQAVHQGISVKPAVMISMQVLGQNLLAKRAKYKKEVVREMPLYFKGNASGAV
jgi:hypothetical protein